jgi:hypothetical protein
LHKNKLEVGESNLGFTQGAKATFVPFSHKLKKEKLKS